MRVEDIFHQPSPPNEHPYWADPVLPALLKRILPQSILTEIEGDLTRLGHDLINLVRPLAAKVHAPTLTHYNAWGERVDLLQTSEGWRALKDLAVKEGYINNAYERKYQEYSRIYMFSKCMMMTGDFHVIMCPFGMTDGAGRVIQLFGSDKMKEEILPRLISCDPAASCVSGQWMTESTGGSDVSRTETRAIPTATLPTDLGPAYLLDGFKWFSSAAEGNLSVALARTGDTASGSGALSLFLVPLRFQSFPTPLSNNIQIHRLKDKIGTHGPPTAELSLNSSRAWLIVRAVDGGTKLLDSIPLHMENLANTTVLYAALTHLTFGTALLLGKSECGVATEEELVRLRLLTPTVKGFTALKAVTAMEECMAALGAQGYIEETGFGRLIRDALVEKIWEGTVDVLALDLIRATRDGHALQSFCQWAAKVISSAPVKSGSLVLLENVTSQLPSLFKRTVNPLLPRSLLVLLGHVASSVYLLEHAIWAQDHGEPSTKIDWDKFSRWVEEGSLKAAVAAVEVLGTGTEDRIEYNRGHVYRSVKL
ncbi:acyl-CoA dehydrogenase NM domain-like protein [Mycena latifolia]|nr:acyl-CoA dehydrogenase NM domain-like protein [Mycena latifolia]